VCVRFYPPPIFRGALRQDLRSDRIQSVHVAKEIHDVLGSGEQRQASLDDDAVETVNQEAFQQLHEGFHRLNRPHEWATNFLFLEFQERSPWPCLDLVFCPARYLKARVESRCLRGISDEEVFKGTSPLSSPTMGGRPRYEVGAKVKVGLDV
jgi:hypothetical protein